mmetsp:Transcript_33684/g.79510  ORF Transcript_33684/g.79510 Transcript_33684/m.79510 type:complete len:307 (-) Transcript_33684:2886-3806(-)
MEVNLRTTPRIPRVGHYIFLARVGSALSRGCHSSRTRLMREVGSSLTPAILPSLASQYTTATRGCGAVFWLLWEAVRSLSSIQQCVTPPAVAQAVHSRWKGRPQPRSSTVRSRAVLLSTLGVQSQLLHRCAWTSAPSPTCMLQLAGRSLSLLPPQSPSRPRPSRTLTAPTAEGPSAPTALSMYPHPPSNAAQHALRVEPSGCATWQRSWLMRRSLQATCKQHIISFSLTAPSSPTQQPTAERCLRSGSRGWSRPASGTTSPDARVERCIRARESCILQTQCWTETQRKSQEGGRCGQHPPWCDCTA